MEAEDVSKTLSAVMALLLRANQAVEARRSLARGRRTLSPLTRSLLEGISSISSLSVKQSVEGMGAVQVCTSSLHAGQC